MLTVLFFSSLVLINRYRDPVSLRIECIEQTSIWQTNTGTSFEITTTIEIWNERYTDVDLLHGTECGIVLDADVNLDDDIVVHYVSTEKLCSNYLIAGTTDVASGISQIESSVRILIQPNVTQLPLGIYQFYSHPVDTTDYNLDATMIVEEDQITMNYEDTPSGWGERSVIFTPVFWLVPLGLYTVGIAFRYFRGKFSIC